MRARVSPYFLVLPLFALVAPSCGDAPTAVDIGFTVATLNDEPPEDLVCVSVSKSEEGGSPEALFVKNLSSFGDPDEDGQGELVLDSNLPAAGTEFEIILEGYAAEDCTGAIVYVARTGQIRLQPGERRFVTMALYKMQSAEALVRGELPPSTFFPTATALPDGRVLIAGGFGERTPGECPAGVSDGDCYEAEATDAAWIFDPPSGLFYPVQGGMLAARGGHTATALDDGRVLIAGGAAAIRMAFVPSATSGGTSQIVFEPVGASGDVEAHGTLEIFEPEAGAVAAQDDLDRDGDAGRGLFVGRADEPDVLAPLNQPRFLHAAALVNDGTVVLAGGMGEDASTTFERFDPRRAGGYGVYDNSGSRLRTPRVMPSAVALETASGEAQVWIVGGVPVAAGNDDLAEVWSVSEEVPSGVTVPGTTLAGFPSMEDAGGVKPPRPHFALLRPQVAPLDGGRVGMVNGWYGPRCPTAATEPAFFAEGEASVHCQRNTGPDRSFSITADERPTVGWQPQSSRLQSFGAVAILPGGRVAVTGGIQDGALITSRDLSLYRATAGEDGAAVTERPGLTLGQGRAFHAAAGLRGGGLMVWGGLTIDSTIRKPSPAGEAYFL